MESLSKKKNTVLIIDDEKSIVDAISAVLSIRGFEVLEAFCGEMAFNLLKDHDPPDLIVLDVLLPGISGLDLCKRFKEDPRLKNVPILMITVITRDSDLADGFWKIGTRADDFVSKPFDPFDLADRIERLLGRFHEKKSPIC